MSRNFLRRFPDGAGQMPGPTHHSAGFAGAQQLSNANGGGALSPVGGFSIEISFWVWFDQIIAGQYQKIVHMGDGAVGTDVLGVQLDGPTGNIVSFSSNGAAYSNVSVPGFVALTQTWYWVWCQYGGAANAIEIYIGGTVATTGGSTASSGVQVINKPLHVGSGPAIAFPLTGRVDSLGWWPKGTPAAISTGDFAALRNRGKAPEFSQLPSSTNLAAWWDFNELTGSANWVDDSGNGNTLAATGVVTRQRGAGF